MHVIFTGTARNTGCVHGNVCSCVCLCMRVFVCVCVPFETNIAGAAGRKAHHYWELASACRRSHHTSIITLEVGSRGGFQQLYRLVQTTVQPLSVTLLGMLFRHCMTFGASGTGIVRFVPELSP